jgi:hypothetical protein
VSADPGTSFLDRIIHLVESAKRQKTPSEIALFVLLSILTLIFVIVVAAMAPVATYLHAQINVADLVDAFGRVDPNNDSGTAFGDRHHRYGPHYAVQCSGDVWQGRRDIR